MISKEQFADEFAELAADAGIGDVCAIEISERMARVHAADPRRYAEVDPWALHFHFAPETLELPWEHRRGLIMHELGHVLCPDGSEDEADAAAERVFGERIIYDKAWPGKGLQCVQMSENPPPRHRTNRYAQDCAECGTHVAEKKGTLRGPPWKTFCAACLPIPKKEKPKIRATLAPKNTVEFRLEGFAGPAFEDYRTACRPCKARKVADKWVNQINLADAGPVLDDMRAIEGLDLIVDDEILAALRGRAEDVAGRLSEARGRLEAVDVMLAERGQALYPYQKRGSEWLATQDSAILADDMGLGKQQPVDAKVLTPNGWRCIGELVVGDKVIGSDGQPTEVTGVFPQGIKPSYRVAFSDHSSVEAGPEHLWTVAYWRGGKYLAEMALTTNELRLRPKKDKLDLSKVRLYLPVLSAPAEFRPQPAPPIPAYLIGQLIANGSLAHGTPALVSNTKDWPSIRSRLRGLGATIGAVHTYGNATRTLFPSIINHVRAMEMDVKSANKRIPPFLFTASVVDRYTLLQGLMDGDGSISKARCKVTYHTISKQLADDVQQLAECLGGIASIREYDRSAEDKSTEYQVRIRMPSDLPPFFIPRKRGRFKPGNRAHPCRTVKSVEYVRDVESVCISVAADDNLYVTEHAILTHNTVQALVAAPEGNPILVVSPAVAKGVWVREAAKWRPDLRPVALKGRKSFRWPESGEMVVTNYDILSDDIPPAPPGVVVIADEAHALKNPKARRTQRFRNIADAARSAGGVVWLLTATPLLGKPPELYALLQAIDRVPFRSFKEFGELMGGYKEYIRGARREVWQWGGTPDPEVAERLRPLMLRRMKTEVLTDLPDKRYQTIDVELKKGLVRKLEKALKEWDTLARPDELPPFEAMSAARAELTEAKIPAMLQLVEEYEDADEPLVVFSAHRAPIDLFADREGWAVITGDTPPAERSRIEDRFQRGELKGVAATIQAGGVAITLTHASNALFVDLDWTPALNSQAEDRIYRIGQDRGVLITQLVGDHEMDRRLADVLSSKQRVIDKSVDATRRTGEEEVSPGEAQRLDALAEALDEEMRGLAAELSEVLEAQEAYKVRVAELDEHARARAEEQIEKQWQDEIRQRAKNRRVELDVTEDDALRAPETNVEEWAQEGLTTLAAYDWDRAQLKNEMGFNKSDGKLGHTLAMRAGLAGLSDAEWQLATAMLAKYWRQIGRMPEKVVPLEGQLSLFENPALPDPGVAENFMVALGENPPYSGYDPRYHQRALPKEDKLSYKRKRDALNVFMDYNRALIDDYGGESMKHSAESFEAINHRYDIQGARRVDTIAKAVWWSMPPGGPPWFLEDIDVEMLNQTAPVIYSPRGLQFEIPDWAEQERLLREEERYYHDVEYPEDEVPF